MIKLTFNPKTIGYWGGKQIVYFLIKEMVALDGKLSNRCFSLNTLKYKIENRGHRPYSKKIEKI